MKYKEIIDEKEIFDSEVVFGTFHKLDNIKIKQKDDKLIDDELLKERIIITEGTINEKQIFDDLKLTYKPLNNKTSEVMEITANGYDEQKIFDYFLSLNQPLYIYNITNDKTNYYSYVNNKELFKDTLLYGEKLYNILENELITIYSKEMPIRTTKNCINNVSISAKIQQIEPIVQQFINDYNIPISQDSSTEDNVIAVSDIVNLIMLIYIIHIIYTNLSKGYDKYKKAYFVLGITKEYNDKDIFLEIARFCNYATYKYHKLGTYQTKIIMQETKTRYILVPMRYATNLFTFAWDFLQNCICSSIVSIENDANEEKNYTLYYRCPVCLKTFSIEKTVNQSFNKTPKIKVTYCDQCSKKQRNINYEKGIAKLYKQIKESLNDIDTTTDEGKQLYDEIKNLKAKCHYRNKKVLNELKERIENNKRR